MSGLRAASVDAGASTTAAGRPSAAPLVRSVVGQAVRAGDGGPRPGSTWPVLRRSADLLVEATASSDRVGRFGLARLAAMHAAWAVCRHRAGDGRGAGPEGLWALMAETCPALADWRLVFDACDRRWAAVCRGGPAPSTREVDDLLREADDFRRLVSVLLSMPAGGPRSLP